MHPNNYWRFRKKRVASDKASKPKSFGGLIRGHSAAVKGIAKKLRDVVYDELPDAEESFYGGQRPMAMYRTSADICWIQPLKERCNMYFMHGIDLSDPQRILEGSSKRSRHVKVRSLADVEKCPIWAWLRESVELNDAANHDSITFDQVLQRMRSICLDLPKTKETTTWGKPHFRVGEKIFCGCGEDRGRPRIGLKMTVPESKMMMKLPGIEKAPYSRKGDGWVAIDPTAFDDWDEIERFIVGSFRLIAPKRVVAELSRRYE